MQHLIFEGAELTGKSWLMSQVYDYLEPKYNKSKVVLDGCHWFNCDIGVHGTKHGQPVIRHYLKIFRELRENNIMVEKFFISDIVYHRLHFKKNLSYGQVEKALLDLGFKIIFVTFPEELGLINKRIRDRLNLYPHYERILHNPEWYIAQQREYLREIEATKLPVINIKTQTLPDFAQVDKILRWIGEK